MLMIRRLIYDGFKQRKLGLQLREGVLFASGAFGLAKRGKSLLAQIT